jgi:hypothetical protein
LVASFDSSYKRPSKVKGMILKMAGETLVQVADERDRLVEQNMALIKEIERLKQLSQK